MFYNAFVSLMAYLAYTPYLLLSLIALYLSTAKDSEMQKLYERIQRDTAEEVVHQPLNVILLIEWFP